MGWAGGRPPRFRSGGRPRRRGPEEEHYPSDARAERRQRLQALREEVHTEEGKLEHSEVWSRMLSERKEEERARRSDRGSKAADQKPLHQEEEVEEEDSMDISGDEKEREDAQEPAPPTAEEEVMMKMLGFTQFSTTKGLKHDDVGGVKKFSKRKYRQYMNRRGGFNRPLSPVN